MSLTAAGELTLSPAAVPDLLLCNFTEFSIEFRGLIKKNLVLFGAYIVYHRAEITDLFDYIGMLHHFLENTGEFVNDLFRRSLGQENAPVRSVVEGYPQFSQSGNVRNLRHTGRMSDPEEFQVSAFYV